MAVSVIPLILSEDAVKALPEDILGLLVDCSTENIMSKIQSYIASADSNPDVREKIKSAYSKQLALKAFLSDERTQQAVDLIKDLDYGSIGIFLSQDELKSYIEAINYILNEPNAVPYINPVSGDNVKVLISAIKDWLDSNEDADVRAFYLALQKFSKFFKDAPSASSKGTIVKKIVRNKTKYRIIMRGSEFLLDKAQKGERPSRWRYL